MTPFTLLLKPLSRRTLFFTALSGFFTFAILFYLLTSDARAEIEKPLSEECSDVDALVNSSEPLTYEQSFVLAEVYHWGICVDQDYVRASELHRSVVGGQFRDISVVRLGYYYFNGLGVEKDVERARYWYRSFALGFYELFLVTPDTDLYPIRQRMLADFFNDKPLPRMLQKELKTAQEQAVGPIDGIMQNYRDLKNGHNVYANTEAAARWLWKAARRQDPEAAYQYALLHSSKKDRQTYEVNLTIAARGGHHLAQRELGLHFVAVNREPIIRSRGLKWLIIAQKSGLDVAAEILWVEQSLAPRYRQYAYDQAAKFALKQ